VNTKPPTSLVFPAWRCTNDHEFSKKKRRKKPAAPTRFPYETTQRIANAAGRKEEGNSGADGLARQHHISFWHINCVKRLESELK
jgi:hypothetical protein